jgi:hypothetical protein
MAEETNVIEIDGSRYDANELTDQQKYWCAQIQDLQRKRQQIQFQLDQTSVALDSFTSSLIQSLDTESDKTEEQNNA